jgi:pyrroline-5-carboxylate reductase
MVISLRDQTFAVIGAGNIGRALIGGLLRNSDVRAESIRATRRSLQSLDSLSTEYPGVLTGVNNAAAVRGASVVLLCVKPQNFEAVAAEIRGHLDAETLVISVLAGITSDAVQSALEAVSPVVRAMPNTPMLVDLGATAISAGRAASGDHLDLARAIFSAVGSVEVVPEDLMDAVTGLSGSGPAYIYMVIEALTDGGVKQGIPRPIALRLAAQTVYGAARLAIETGKHPAILRDEVTTPGGTAIAAVADLEAHGLRTMLINAVATATRRSRELSGLSD